ncbi:MAG: hypothetical protein Tsb002_11560 [Wenzhouxiangellaceae bacterium]
MQHESSDDTSAKPATESTPLSDQQFSELPLHEALQRNLQAIGFNYCTPIQAEALPVALAGKDVAGQARTGTGKTAAFLLVMLDRLLREPTPEGPTRPRGLIIAPTRELAVQIHRDAEPLVRDTGLKLALIFGGVDYAKQRQTLADGVDIIIGTPGRLIDYFKQKVFTLRQVRVAVLDEADRMFDLGFIKDIRFLLRRLPPREQRQCLLFSATLGYRVMELAYEHMNNPETVAVGTEQVTAENITEQVYYPSNEEKLPLLVHLLRGSPDAHSIVFVNTRDAAQMVAATLTANGFHVAVLSGSVPQAKRLRLLNRFHSGEINILIATDVAARGLHIPDVTHVFNFDLPQEAADYVHRIGRTARLGASGMAVSFACENYAFHLPDIEAYTGKRIAMENVPNDELEEIQRAPRQSRRDEQQRPRRRRRPRSKPNQAKS